jgi:hypothetical protein
MLGHKISKKARHGRHVRRPDHKPHRKPTGYSRHARILKRRVALALAPTVEASLSESDVRSSLHQRGEILTMAGALAPPPVEQEASWT